MAYTKKIWKDYPDTTTQIKAEDLNNIENGIEAVDTALENLENNVNNIEDGLEAVTNNVNNGWISLNGTFTFVSWDSTTYTGVVNSNLDLTSYLSVGMKIKFTQSSAVKYGIITKITSDQITLFMGQNYTLNNSGISNAFYSMLKAPFGFPLQREKWTVSSVTNEVVKTNPTNGTWYNSGTRKITVPIGNWKISYITACAAYVATTADIQIYVALSSTNNGASYTDLISFVRGNALQYFGAIFSGSKDITFTTKTDLFLNERVTTNSIMAIEVAKNSNIILKAECAYL